MPTKDGSTWREVTDERYIIIINNVAPVVTINPFGEEFYYEGCDFKLSLTHGGPTIDITNNGSGIHRLRHTCIVVIPESGALARFDGSAPQKPIISYYVGPGYRFLSTLPLRD